MKLRIPVHIYNAQTCRGAVSTNYSLLDGAIITTFCDGDISSSTQKFYITGKRGNYHVVKYDSSALILDTKKGGFTREKTMTKEPLKTRKEAKSKMVEIVMSDLDHSCPAWINAKKLRTNLSKKLQIN